MSGSGTDARRGSFRAGLACELRAWGAADGMKWLLVFKTILAALLAMWLSMRFELDRPATAMITVVIVMQQQTGLVLGKSLYRIAGTLAGTLASLVLVGLFAQQRLPFLAGLALWVGFCTSGAALLRNFRSYGFVLAGYTAAMIGLPASEQPQAFFAIASTRVSEIVIGILCAGIVSDVIMPQRLSDSIARRLRNRYAEFIAFMRAMFRGAVSPEEYERTHVRFIADAIGFEALRGSAILEDAEIRARDLGLRQLNSAYMSLSTTFHSLHQLVKRLLRSGGPTSRALQSLQALMNDIFPAETRAPITPAEARQEVRRIAAFRATLAKRVSELRTSWDTVADPQTRLDFDTALELLYRFIREMNAYAATYAALLENRDGLNRRAPGVIRFYLRTDLLVAALSGARAVVATLLAGAFWIASSWPSGINAVMNAGIVSALFAATPQPACSARRMTIGFSIGFAAAFVCAFFMVPALDSFTLLCATVIPFLLAFLYLEQFFPASAGIGIGAAIFFLNMLSPSNVAQPDALAFINDGLAAIMGVGAAAVMFGTLMPADAAWLKRRMVRQIRHQVIGAAREPLDGILHRFESGTRDALRTLAGRQQIRGAHDRHILASLFAALELGHALIHLRRDAAAIPLAAPLERSLDTGLDAIVRLIRQPTPGRHGAALTAITASMTLLGRESCREDVSRRSRAALRRMSASLHLIRIALLDDETVLALTTGTPPHTHCQGVPHVA